MEDVRVGEEAQQASKVEAQTESAAIRNGSAAETETRALRLFGEFTAATLGVLPGLRVISWVPSTAGCGTGSQGQVP